MRKLVLIDFSWLYNKYYYVAKYSLSSQEGIIDKDKLESILLRMLLQFLTLIKRSYREIKVALALDSPTSTLNNFKIFEGYKQNRNKEEKKEVYSFLNSILEQLVKTLDSKSFSFMKAKGYEADQILAYIIKKYHEKYQIILFSGDKDLLQLTAYKNVFVSDKFEKGNFMIKTDEEIFQKFKNSKGEDFTRISSNKKDILKYRVFKGDVSDNLSPVYPRIRDKDIKEIVQNYWLEDDELSEDLVETIISRVKEHNLVLAEKLEYNKDTWLRNYRIMDLLHVGEINMKRLK
jgi:DNA polymerase-1